MTHARSVARWASTAAVVEGPHGTRLALIPRVVCLRRADAEALLATGRPELALFAAWAVHAQRSDAAARLVRRAIVTMGALPDAALRDALVRGMINMVGDELRAKLRELLMDLSKVTEGPLMRDLREEFERRGKLEGEASALLRVLSRRGIAVDDGMRARVLACSDAATLDAWLDRAATAADATQVFGDDGA